jgi:hypothetical protein
MDNPGEDLSDRELLDALGVEVEVARPKTLTARQERIIAGFEDIQRFYEEHGRAPRHGEDRDIFERLYAVRLDRIRELPECRELLEPLDKQGLLKVTGVEEDGVEFLHDDELLAQLGVASSGADDITQLRNVKSRAEIAAAEEIAQRKRCTDFDRFKPLFEAVRRDLDNGARQTRRFGENTAIQKGEFFILGGQIAYIAEMPDELETTEHGHAQGRLRIIYDNGTEGDNLLRSFVRALYKDETGRRITNPDMGPLFGGVAEEDDLESGTIYVLRSQSDHPVVAANRELIHKIGVTGGAVEMRIAQAATDATYLLADVDVIATYKLFNINRTKLENILHRVFEPARLALTIEDRFGNPVQPREWYLVPLSVIAEAVEKISDGSIVGVEYDPASARLAPATPKT